MSIPAEDNVFAGPLAKEYELLKLLCPGLPVLRSLLGEYIGAWQPAYPAPRR